MESLGKTSAAIILAAGAGLGGSAALGQATPSVQQLQQQIDAMQKQINAIKSQQSAETTREKVMADAQGRTPLSPITAGWEDGEFVLRSEDGRFSLIPKFQFQFRYVANLNDSAPAGGSDNETGFEVRRMKFAFEGNAFSKELTYEFKWETDRDGGGVSLEEAWVKYALGPQWAIRGGSFKDPLAHEQLTGAQYQLAADRSLLNQILIGGDNYIQGLELLYGNKATPLHGMVALSNGTDSSNTGFSEHEANFGAAGRVEYKLAGDWKDYSQFTARSTKHDLLVVGGGADITQTGSENALTHTVDAQYKLPSGWGFYAAYVGRYATSDEGDHYDGGVVAQAGYAINKNWEVFGRYDYVGLSSDDVPAGADNHIHEITAGVNYYIEGQHAKFTLDGVYLPNGAPYNYSGLGILASDGQEFVMRAQFQLLL